MRNIVMDDVPAERDLLLLIAEGDKTAFEYVYHLFYRPVCYFALQLLERQDEAEDMVLTAFHKLWERRGSFSSLAGMRSFMYTTVRNHCLNSLKHRRVITQAHKALLQDSTEDYIEYHLLKAEYLKLIYAEISALPQQQRQLLEWSFLEELSTAEIASRLQLAESSVRSAKTRALAQLRTTLREKNLLVMALFLFPFYRDHIHF